MHKIIVGAETEEALLAAEVRMNKDSHDKMFQMTLRTAGATGGSRCICALLGRTTRGHQVGQGGFVMQL